MAQFQAGSRRRKLRTNDRTAATRAERAMPLTKDVTTALLETTDGRSELYDGELREKPMMTFGHNHAVMKLFYQLFQRLPADDFHERVNAGHLAIPNGDSYVPDLMVVPVSVMRECFPDRRAFEQY